jgi:hypothetical protein
MDEVIHLISASHVINKTHSWRRTMLVILDGLGSSRELTKHILGGGRCWSYWMVWAQVETRGAGAANEEVRALCRYNGPKRRFGDSMVALEMADVRFRLTARILKRQQWRKYTKWCTANSKRQGVGGRMGMLLA